MSAAAANPQLANQAALARMLGVSRQAINDLVKRQVIPISQDGLIDVQLAKVAIANRVRPSGKTAGPAPTTTPAPDTGPNQQQPDANLSYHVAKTLREVAEAKLAQLKLAELQGSLVRVEDVRASLARRAATFREALLQIPGRLAAQLAAETDQARAHALLDVEIRAAMAQLVTEA